ncbi:hypothetical protein DKX38_003982 [Salix brachista]|uniref:Uncharacterized protein n=1 Tax=Salix brachista TaxID=2182728 RepID=A0A5N5NA67_9ROSI|nr:hypothetical protein DKX38_003982 [Salix brachista]
MDIEQKQVELIDHFVNQASTLKASTLWPLIIEATSHPSLFAFSEILSVPTVSEVSKELRILCTSMFFGCLLTEPRLTTKVRERNYLYKRSNDSGKINKISAKKFIL